MHKIMKYITLIVVLFFENCITEEIDNKIVRSNIRTVSIEEDEIIKMYDIKISKNEDYKCHNLETLNLEDMNFRKLKDNIIRCDGMRHITLKKNLLDDIPRNVLKNVPYLYCLNLSKNRINIYNSNPLQHDYLQVLDLSYQDMSPAIKPSLRDVEEFAEEEIESIYKYMVFNSTDIFLPSLKHLDLSGNDISAIPLGFNISFPQLTHVYLNNIYAVKLDPQFFAYIPKSLKVIHLENNHIKNLTLHNIADVTALHLDGNPLETIDIMSMKLRVLSLRNCTMFVKGTFDTPYLEQLDLSLNNLYTVSYISFDIFQFLQTLLLDNNKLSEVPLLHHSELLNVSLSYNMIENIPSDSFVYLTALKKLSLKGNKIRNIDKKAFTGLKKLEYLDLSENVLKNLPHYWMLPLMELRYLNVNSNYFVNVPDLTINLNSLLRHLSVKNNSLTKITTIELEKLPAMITVYL